MRFIDEGYIIGIRRHGENSGIITILCKEQGKVCGYVKSCFSKKNLATFQIGNLIKVDAWSRVDDNMLSLKIELITPYAVNFLASQKKLQTLSSFCGLCNECLPELQSVDKLYDFASNFIKFIDEENWLTHYCFFEFHLLDFLGIGLDLTKCVVTGRQDNLAYVSPKSACAVSYDIGLNYKDKLFDFPKFIVEENYYPTLQEQFELLRMTEFFLKKNFFAIHNLKFPISRANLGANL
ncbi:MAG: DNA repair protein RecO [Alphaproteobacteria bacterium]|nr:DNA repair protein RecO [Alphaproteobacteria bacterium]